MKLFSSLVAVVGIAAAIPAVAAPTLDFEDQASFLSLDYTGNPYGIAANGALLALENDGLAENPTGNYFSGNPSGSKVMFATEPLAGERAEITSSLGFGTAISFFYSAATAGVVSIRDMSGAVLQAFNFEAVSTNADDSPFDTWVQQTVAFSGIAYSIDFSGATGALFDNVGVNVVPLPAAVFLLPFGLAALGLAGRRRKPEVASGA
jgi:hypothetical protein